MMSNGAMLIFDDYFAWEGCRQAVDEALAGVVSHPSGEFAFTVWA
jgi:hypothetical protein